MFNAGDLTGNGFDLPLYIPAIDVQYLANNLRFQDIDIQPDTLTSGQSVALNAIGTQTTTNLRYVFPGNFTINQGATLTVGPNLTLLVGSAPQTTQTLTDNGTLTFAAGDVVTLNDNNFSAVEQIVVGSGGLLSASGTTFNATNANNSIGGNSTAIVVNAGGHLQAHGSTFSVGQLNLNIGAVVNAGDLAGNAFDLPLFIPAIDVQFLSGASNNNLRFRDIDIQPDTLTSTQSVALNAIGTQITTNLRYVFPGSFTINQGGPRLPPWGPTSPVLVGTAPQTTQTLTDNGTLTFAAGDVVTLNDNNFSAVEQIVVGSGGLFQASASTFNATNANNSSGSNATLIVVNNMGHLQANGSDFAVGQLNFNIGATVSSGDLVGNAFDLPLFIPAIDVQFLYGYRQQQPAAFLRDH